MLPRVDISYLSTTRSNTENLEIIRDSGHTRFPLGDPDLDQVVGMVHGKDVLAALLKGDSVEVAELVRDIPTVLDTLALSRYIVEAQRQQRQCALVVDEHGTTVGMVFLEDALAEIVGPIHDEFDERRAWIDTPKPGVTELSGSVPLPDAAALLGLDASGEEDTVGGFVAAQLGRLPEQGEQLRVSDYLVTVLEVGDRRIARLRFEAGKGS